jgi:hypothetical protein
LDVVPVPVGLEDRAHVEGLAELEQEVVLVRGVEQDRVAALAAAQHVDVVVDRPHDDLVDLGLRVAPEQRVGRRHGWKATRMTSWTGTCKSTWAVPLAVGFAVIGLLVIVFTPGWGVLSLLLALVLAHFRSLSVVIDDAGLRVTASGPVPWRVRFPLGDIESVEAIAVEPWRRGGWGYRGSMTFFKRAAWILRRGDGIQVGLTGGRRFVVTVDDAAAGAAALDQRVRSTPR